MKRDRQNLRESRDQTAELQNAVEQFTLAIQHTDAMLAEVGHAASLAIHYGPDGLAASEAQSAAE